MKVFKKIGDFLTAMVPFFVYIGVQLIVVVLGGIAALVVEMISFSQIPESVTDLSFRLVSLSTYVIILPVLLFEMKLQRLDLKAISPQKQNGRVYIMTFFFAVGAFFAFSLLNSLLLRITGVTADEASEQMSYSLFVIRLLIVLTSGLGEELLYRGIMVKTFERYFSPVFSAVVITLPFTLLHSENRILYLLLLGVSLMFIRYKFGDLRLCLMVNLTAGILVFMTELIDSSLYGTVMTVGGVIGIFISAAAMFFMLKFASAATPASEKS